MNENQDNARPALTIHVQSWATPIVGLVMLVLGLAAGFWGRPLLDKPDALAVAPTEAISTAIVPTTVAAAPTTAPADQAGLEELMDYMVSQVRHFRGDPTAPVTILEFSDFQ